MTPIRKEANEAFKKFAPVPIDEKGCFLAGARWMAENRAKFYEDTAKQMRIESDYDEDTIATYETYEFLAQNLRQLAKELSP